MGLREPGSPIQRHQRGSGKRSVGMGECLSPGTARMGCAGLLFAQRTRRSESGNPRPRRRGREKGTARGGQLVLGTARLGSARLVRHGSGTMKPRGYGFLLLLLHILKAVIALEKKNIISKLGDNATLSCIYNERDLQLKNLRVYWQLADDDQAKCSVVHALISGQDNNSNQCIHFKDRTQLFWDRLENGDFSLLLLNVSQRDEHTYKCVVQEKTEYTQVIHQAEVVLSLAASYSQPILSGPIRNSSSTGEEVTFSCKSGNGYPKPKVYWINKVNNSRLNPSELQITPHSDGTFSVFSTLRVKAASNMQIECSIENEMLQENLSANYTQQKRSNGSGTDSDENLEKKGRGAQAAGIIAIVILIGLLTVLICWLWRRRSSNLVSYTDVQPNEDQGGLS
ncbi:PREDICTED: ICOS ligand isoform X2 [Corvus brachyrhynchos]|uniref:ICOS ligand isoform X1 n=1 Tax=Corvus brachyrhynchos TaxID=85066 RepID=UPI000816571E|nr:PREDICTED: ICOS ligand isoform X1 [Corvus brachyrhynchos]XP_017588780.1 PREDICTED: ICOS ligand isoform X2 [Corvus brachyrhynchos]